MIKEAGQSTVVPIQSREINSKQTASPIPDSEETGSGQQLEKFGPDEQ
jgi:hypothetical protein